VIRRTTPTTSNLYGFLMLANINPSRSLTPAGALDFAVNPDSGRKSGTSEPGSRADIGYRGWGKRGVYRFASMVRCPADDSKARPAKISRV
jgi:hypothetical protein